MVEHFREFVAPLLNGQARAMVVGSRQVVIGVSSRCYVLRQCGQRMRDWSQIKSTCQPRWFAISPRASDQPICG